MDRIAISLNISPNDRAIQQKTEKSDRTAKSKSTAECEKVCREEKNKRMQQWVWRENLEADRWLSGATLVNATLSKVMEMRWIP